MKKAGIVTVKNDVCRNCHGHGCLAEISSDDFKSIKCDVCNGSGMVVVRKEIQVTITPKIPFHEEQPVKQH